MPWYEKVGEHTLALVGGECHDAPMKRTTASPADTRTDSPPPNREGRRHPEKLLDYTTTAPILGCSPRMVRKLVESRELASVKVGRLVRIEPDAVVDYIESHRRKAAS
jgi:excisionase family DNA binding protein